MEFYLVGGAVRDRLLGETVVDRDWVVVDGSADQLTAQGFRSVGRDFPVFLHPETHEEYALARTERKTGRGYRGFEVQAEGVSLEDDLARRDLTINAMAEDTDGQLIDPHGGRQDLEAGLLRHVSPAFAEDPVRILRVARFLARYAHRGFRIADETLSLMRQMVNDGEVDALVPERVWQEIDKALTEPTPSAFVRALRECGALARLLPEVDVLFGVPQPAEYHPEVDTGEHVLMTLDAAAGESSVVVFACLVHDLGKGLTPKDQWPSHRGHEEAGMDPVRAVCKRLRVPGEHREMALRVCLHHLRAHRSLQMRDATVLDLIQSVEGLRQPSRFEGFLRACRADWNGRTGYEDRAYPQAEFLLAARDAAAAVSAAPLMERGLKDHRLGQALRSERIQAIRALSRPSE